MTTTTLEKPKRAKTAGGITLATQTLRAALAVVIKAVPTKGTRPIMQNVRLGDGLLTGSDLEIRIDREIDYHGEPMLLPAHRLSAILRAATGDEVYLTAKDATVTVRCGAGSWTLPTEDVAEYPHWEPEDLKSLCRLPADQFGRAAKATTYAADSESSRYALGGVLLDVTPTDDGSMQHWVATDGRRLACVETESDQAVDASQTIVPGRLMAAVASLATGDGSVQIEANAKEIRFTLTGCVVTGRLLEGRFPRWRDVVGEPEGEPSVLDCVELLQAVNAAAIVTSEQSKGVSLNWTSGTLVLAGRSSEYGESLCHCPTIAAGTTASTRLDPQYMAQFLSHLPADEEPHVSLYVKDAASRVLLRCGTYTGVIMPLSEDA
jgi:DNA polymerase-3 subunit beta